jgi:hypothetical protein
MFQKKLTLAAVLLCAGCAGGPPAWVTSPVADGGGFAATDCARDSGKLSVDRQVALAKARAGIAQQFAQRVRAMDRAYAGLRDPATATQPGAATPFALASKSVTEQLAGLAPARVEYVEIDEVRQLCAMVAVEAAPARELFDRLVSASGETIDDATREKLFAEFTGGAPVAE